MSNVNSTASGSTPAGTEARSQDASVGAPPLLGDGILGIGIPPMNAERLAFLLQGLNVGAHENMRQHLFDKAGKPNLSLPNLGSSEEDPDGMDIGSLLARSQAAINKINVACLRTAITGLDISATQVKVANEERQAKLGAWAEKQNALGAEARGPFGWLIAIFKAIATFFAAVVTVMLAMAFPNPLTIAAAVLAVAGFAASLVEISGKISQAAGGPSFTLATLLPTIVTALCTAFGMEESKARRMGDFVGGMLALPVCLVDTSGLSPFIQASMEVSGMTLETVEKVLPWLTLAMTVLLAVLTTAVSVMSGNATGSMQVASTAIRAMQSVATMLNLGVLASSSAQSIQMGVLTSHALQAQSDVRMMQAAVELLISKQEIAQENVSKLLTVVGKTAESWGKAMDSLFGAQKAFIRRMA